MNQKNKILLTIIIFVFTFLLIGCNKNVSLGEENSWTPLVEEINLEYGEIMEFTSDVFIDNPSLEFIEFRQNIPIMTRIENAQFVAPPLSTYEEVVNSNMINSGYYYFSHGGFIGFLVVSDGDNEYEFEITIRIEDTTPPNITPMSELVLSVGSNNSELLDLFQITDFSAFTVKIHENINWESPGEYEFIIFAEDAKGNIVQENFILTLR